MRATPHGNRARLGMTIPREAPRGSFSNMKVIVARYPGRCEQCGASIRKGDSVVWRPGHKITCAGGHRRAKAS